MTVFAEDMRWILYRNIFHKLCTAYVIVAARLWIVCIKPISTVQVNFGSTDYMPDYCFLNFLKTIQQSLN